jgi:hypothetical protein
MDYVKKVLEKEQEGLREAKQMLEHEIELTKVHLADKERRLADYNDRLEQVNKALAPAILISNHSTGINIKKALKEITRNLEREAKMRGPKF